MYGPICETRGSDWMWMYDEDIPAYVVAASLVRRGARVDGVLDRARHDRPPVCAA
ncbi:hypothetical protein D1872_300100 [compost metagenome]